jgi:hypothetical protein
MTGQLNQKRPMILLSVWSCLPPAAANRGCWSHQTGFAAAGGKQDMRAEETFGKSLVLAGQSTLHRRGVGGGGFSATSVVSMTSSQKSNSKWRCPTSSIFGTTLFGSTVDHRLRYSGKSFSLSDFLGAGLRMIGWSSSSFFLTASVASFSGAGPSATAPLEGCSPEFFLNHWVLR